jgi:hypothetical protein
MAKPTINFVLSLNPRRPLTSCCSHFGPSKNLYWTSWWSLFLAKRADQSHMHIKSEGKGSSLRPTWYTPAPHPTPRERVKIPISSLVIVGKQHPMSDPVVLHGNTKSNTATIIHAVFLEPAKRQCSAKCSNWLKVKLVPFRGGGVRGHAEIGYYKPPGPPPPSPHFPIPPTHSRNWIRIMK